MEVAAVRRHAGESLILSNPGQQLTSHGSTAELAVADSTDCNRDHPLQQISTHTMCTVQLLVCLAYELAPLISCL